MPHRLLESGDRGPADPQCPRAPSTVLLGKSPARAETPAPDEATSGSRGDVVHTMTLTTALECHPPPTSAPNAPRCVGATPTAWTCQTVRMALRHHPLFTAFRIEQVMHRQFPRLTGNTTGLMRVYYLALSLNISRTHLIKLCCRAV